MGNGFICNPNGCFPAQGFGHVVSIAGSDCANLPSIQWVCGFSVAEDLTGPQKVIFA
jgi:hypothetical protein